MTFNRKQRSKLTLKKSHEMFSEERQERWSTKERDKTLYKSKEKNHKSEKMLFSFKICALSFSFYRLCRRVSQVHGRRTTKTGRIKSWIACVRTASIVFSFNWFCLNRIQTKMSLSRQIFVHLILCKWKRFNLSPHPLSTISWAASGLVGEDGRSLSRERNPLVPLDFEWGWSHADNRGDNLIVLCGWYKTHSHRIYIYITLLRIYS